jgi:hydroxypyruvate isomerase
MTQLSRRDLLRASGAAALSAMTGPTILAAASAPSPPLAGRLKQSVSRWPFERVPFDEFCRAASNIGLAAIDLLDAKDWPRVREYGLVCSMGNPTDRSDFIERGFNDHSSHPLLLGELETAIPRAREHGVPNVIAMFGNRGGSNDADAIAACIDGLGIIAPLAEEYGITVCVELLNSKVSHMGYQGDRTWFGVEVIEGVNSPRVKLLYDIYHMQIMEGDVIRTIRDNSQHIAHFHTGGVPGRHELDDTQELNWRAIATAIADLDFTGYVAHEFVPTGDPLTSLRQAFAICDV